VAVTDTGAGMEMANVSTPDTGTKAKVREELSKTIPGAVFRPKRLPLGRKADGLMAYHDFDAVSDDGTVAVLIDEDRWLSGDGERNAGRVSALYQKVYFLSLTTAITKLLVLTDRDTYLGFGRESDGRLPEDVKLWHMPVPEEPGILWLSP